MANTRILLPYVDPLLLHVVAEVPGVRLARDAEGRPIVPVLERLHAEAAIDEFADLLSVVLQCSRDVESGPLCIAVEGEGAEDFSGITDIAPQSLAAPTRPRVIADDSRLQAFSLLKDRAEGASLLAASQSTPSPVNRAREIFRLFEAAFAKPLNGLATQLHNFLATSPHKTMAFKKAEIKHWEGLRGPIMHADIQIYGPADVVPMLPRLEWAAYDVLFNKSSWGSGDWDRRAALAMNSGVSPNGAVLRFQEATSPTEIVFLPVDQYGVYPQCREVSRMDIPAGLASDLAHHAIYSPPVSAVGDMDVDPGRT